MLFWPKPITNMPVIIRPAFPIAETITTQAQFLDQVQRNRPLDSAGGLWHVLREEADELELVQGQPELRLFVLFNTVRALKQYRGNWENAEAIFPPLLSDLDDFIQHWQPSMSKQVGVSIEYAQHWRQLCFTEYQVGRLFQQIYKTVALSSILDAQFWEQQCTALAVAVEDVLSLVQQSAHYLNDPHCRILREFGGILQLGLSMVYYHKKSLEPNLSGTDYETGVTENTASALAMGAAIKKYAWNNRLAAGFFGHPCIPRWILDILQLINATNRKKVLPAKVTPPYKIPIRGVVDYRIG